MQQAFINHNTEVFAGKTYDEDKLNGPRKTHSEGHAKPTKARSDIDILRGRVTRSRLELRELRVQLRQHHVHIREMQTLFWRCLQKQWNENGEPNQPTLQKLYDEILTALDEIGPEEESYNEKEDDLDLLEYKLGKMEDRFYALDAPSEDSSTVEFASATSNASSPRSWNTTPNYAKDGDFLSHRYRSRVGDANIMKERLLELTTERAQYLDTEANRRAMDLPLYQPNVDFLATFEEVYTTHLEELHRIEEEVVDLKAKMNKTYPDSKEGLPVQADALIPHLPYSQVTYQSSKPSRCSQSSTNRQSGGGIIRVPVDASSVRQRINRWILDGLMSSALERARHQAILHNRNIDNTQWRSLVFEYWKSDRASSSRSSAASNSVRHRALTSEGGDGGGSTAQTPAFEAPWRRSIDVGYFGLPLSLQSRTSRKVIVSQHRYIKSSSF